MSEDRVVSEETPGERVRFLQAVALFEEFHGALKERLAATPERRAVETLDAALALVKPAAATRSGKGLDVGSFESFRDSVEALAAATPEARALALFEGAMREMLKAAPDFDDLPDADETTEEAAEAGIDSGSETAHADEPHGVTADADDAPASGETEPEASAGEADEPSPEDEVPGEMAQADEPAAEEIDPAERIAELEAELAKARARLSEDIASEAA